MSKTFLVSPSHYILNFSVAGPMQMRVRFWADIIVGISYDTDGPKILHEVGLNLACSWMAPDNQTVSHELFPLCEKVNHFLWADDEEAVPRHDSGGSR
jgi:hypothetical protein